MSLLEAERVSGQFLDVYLMTLTEKMPQMCKAVIKAKGVHFEENIIWAIYHVFVDYYI